MKVVRTYQDDPFLRMDSLRYDDMLADAAISVMRTVGVDALTTAALARWLRVSPSAVTHRAPRHETVRLIVQGLGRRWLQWSLKGVRLTGIPPLPVTQEERHGLRVWLTLEELSTTQSAAGHPEAQDLHAYFRSEERRLLEEWWGGGSGAEGGGAGAGIRAFEVFYTLLVGLRGAMAREVPVVETEVARAMLAAALGRPPAPVALPGISRRSMDSRAGAAGCG
jgi:hypothetical protein